MTTSGLVSSKMDWSLVASVMSASKYLTPAESGCRLRSAAKIDHRYGRLVVAEQQADDMVSEEATASYDHHVAQAGFLFFAPWPAAIVRLSFARNGGIDRGINCTGIIVDLGARRVRNNFGRC